MLLAVAFNPLLNYQSNKTLQLLRQRRDQPHRLPRQRMRSRIQIVPVRPEPVEGSPRSGGAQGNEKQKCKT